MVLASRGVETTPTNQELARRMGYASVADLDVAMIRMDAVGRAEHVIERMDGSPLEIQALMLRGVGIFYSTEG